MLQGKTALITGSSQGIGLAVAQAFARNRARVVLTSERPLEACPGVQEVLELPGCFAAGADMGEPREALGEEISLYLPEPGDVKHVELEDEPGPYPSTGFWRGPPDAPAACTDPGGRPCFRQPIFVEDREPPHARMT